MYSEHTQFSGTIKNADARNYGMSIDVTTMKYIDALNLFITAILFVLVSNALRC